MGRSELRARRAIVRIPGRIRLLSGFGVLGLVLVSAAVAVGASTPAPPDSAATPVPADGAKAGWHQFAGAPFGSPDAPIKDNGGNPIVPVTVDFFTVSFNGGGDGYAGGAVCQEGATNTDTCPRVPVIYHYTAASGQPPSWSKVVLPSRDPAHPVGYVGGLAYLPDGRVLAVGGDGTYPRREQPSDQPDQAGMARAWLYSAGSWCELGAGSSCGVLPAGMRGMTALDCSPREGDNGLCAAGGLRQLWMWKGDRFDAHGYNDTSTDVDRAGEWRFRVRSVRFASGEKAPPAVAVALTSGCCYVDPATHQADPTKNTGRVLLYDGQSWYVRTLFDSRGGTEHTQTLPDSYFGALLTSASNGQELSLVAAPVM